MVQAKSSICSPSTWPVGQSVEGFCCLFESDSTRCSAGDGATGTCDRRGNDESSSSPVAACDTIGIDGMCCDSLGNIYGAAGDGKTSGIYIFSPEGKELAFLPVPETVTTWSSRGRYASSWRVSKLESGVSHSQQ